jgi:predicted CopG family antitoxin
MVNKKAQTKIIRVSRNSYDSLLFMKSQLETKLKEPKSFSDVVDYLVGKWCKRYDKKSK